ncbi:MAG: carboxypeptidase-like regulatory domain-containing protein [Gemmataceae bacterium]|nr:carboxypeptidase-like regulatory domain-containing protein [Gemmataceae bacterium]
MKRLRAGVPFALVVVAAGCSGPGRPTPAAEPTAGDPATGHVTGRVTYRGQPVPAGVVTFRSDRGFHPVPLREDGTYSLAGLAAGRYAVSVDTEMFDSANRPPGEISPSGGFPTESREDRDRLYMRLPKKYADPRTSGLAHAVTGGEQQKGFDLAD